MTTTTAPSHPSKCRQKNGFSLVEMMVALTVITMVLAALFSSWGFVGRSTMALGHYVEMNSKGRVGLEIFARDVRRARDIAEGFNSTAMTLKMVDSDGVESTVRYFYDASGRTLVRQAGSWQDREFIFKDVEWLEFSYFTTNNETPPDMVALETRLIQVELGMARQVQRRDTTKKIVSARYIMRNKLHGQ
jgi:prepilin-type N-terminal cleavage/methylation domain-containing protein